ncbi:hypothetical protein [Corallococcus sp. CA047B]|uniref:hypothetical protein n=1 Tax=Corallococcus sp. CA047B TaxID=2316729 RepID=UPI0011C45E3D|nr:hypothetical protein [Corallococcus sp. CA047B]
MHSSLEEKSRGGWTTGVLLGVLLVLGACDKDPDDIPALQPGAQGESAVTAPEGARFELAVRGGQRYRFDCTPISLTGCRVQLRDAKSLEPVGDAQASSLRNVLSFFWTADAEGRVVVEVQSAPTGKTGQFLYAFTEAVDDAGGSVAEAVSRPVDTTPTEFTGFLESRDDVDAWRLSLPANHVLRAVCKDAEITHPAPDMEVVLPDGTSLGRFNATESARLAYWMGAKSPNGGDLILLVQASSAMRAGSARYTCQVWDTGPDDHPDAPPATTLLRMPGAVDVMLYSEKDIDVLAADLLEGHQYLLREGSPRSDPYYCATTVTNAQGVVLGTNLRSDRTGVVFTAPATGRYELSLQRARGEAPETWFIPGGFTYAISDITPP